ncbi:MAG: LptA/OstA family protein, partial [Victivallaceae bacterium]
MKKFILFLSALLLLNCAGSRGDELGALKIYKARLPIYHKKRLQLMIFCAVMTRKADKIFAEEAVIDIFKRNININNIKYLEDIKPYVLGTTPADVAEFWKDKTFSHGFIYSSKAIIQQESKVASGNEKVFFRSPQLDLNGIGFTANFDTRVIKVLEDVDILIRTNPYKKDAKEKTDTIIKAKSNSMIIDMGKELITLIGNVKVDEANFNIFCDRLEIDLKKNKQDKTGKDEAKQDEGLTPSGVSQITCIDNVKIIRKISAEEKQKNGSQKAFADRAVYKTTDEQIILTGKNPQIYRGNDMISGEKIILWKKSERLQVFKNCLVKMTAPQDPKKKETELNSDFIDFDYAKNIAVFTGHVRVKNADFKLNCNKMTIYLEDRAKPEKDLKKSLIAASGKKDLKEIVCTGDVVIRRMNSEKNEKALAENAVYVLKENKITLSGGSPFIISGTDSVSGKRMLVWLDQNRLKVTKNSKIIINQDSIAPKAGTGKTTVTSNSSDLNYGGNELSFSGSVKIDNPQMNLVCDNMKIFLDETEKTKKPEKTPKTDMSLISPGNSGGKDVNRIVCIGSVRVDDPKAAMNCDRMVITFRDRPAGKLASSLGSLGGGSK